MLAGRERLDLGLDEDRGKLELPQALFDASCGGGKQEGEGAGQDERRPDGRQNAHGASRPRRLHG
jgi:hypothetical protein